MYQIKWYKTKEETNLATHNIPRDVKGEGRILFIFTTRSLIFAAAGLVVCLLVSSLIGVIFSQFYVKLIICLIFAEIGYGIASFKIPDSPRFEITRKAGGERIYDVIMRAIKFKAQKRRIYVYTKEEKNNG